MHAGRSRSIECVDESNPIRRQATTTTLVPKDDRKPPQHWFCPSPNWLVLPVFFLLKEVGSKAAQATVLKACALPRGSLLLLVLGLKDVRIRLMAASANPGVAVVVALGSEASIKHAHDAGVPHRRVALLGGGRLVDFSATVLLVTWRHDAMVPITDVLRVPKTLTPTAAATLLVNPTSALRMLTDFVDLQKGDVVVQNAGNSAVGQYVAQIYICVSVLIVALGVSGTLVTYDAMTAAPLASNPGLFVVKNLTLKGFWLAAWTRTAPATAYRALLDELVAMYASGALQAPNHNEIVVPRVGANEEDVIKSIATAGQGFAGRKQLLVFQ
ncbi:hypothetical protein BC828DRAFT_415943 [Blastocladiella britannica]|nr:hypothetical protein BC828DRAFT_415943 [Blastocladiella britannica]